MKREIPLVNGEIYHILSRSIAEYKVFNDKQDCERMMKLLKYYQTDPDCKFSDFLALKAVLQNGFNNYLEETAKDKEDIVQIIAYCLMPTHIHLILKQLKDNGISQYFGNILNSYSRYFNTKHKRKGPLWETKFKNVLVKNDEQLLHLTRYIHLNPVTACLVDKPEGWSNSSYKEYIELNTRFKICQYDELLDVKPRTYQKFVNDRIVYQRELAKIKTLLLD